MEKKLLEALNQNLITPIYKHKRQTLNRYDYVRVACRRSIFKIPVQQKKDQFQSQELQIPEIINDIQDPAKNTEQFVYKRNFK